MTVDADARIVMAAGEASGDLLAAPLLPALRARLPNARFAGIAGDRMIEQGCKAWWHVRELSVRGYVEVVRELPRLLRMRAQLRRRVLRNQPTAFIGIDSPDFNLGIEVKLRAAGIPVVHFISPSIWAWRGERIEVIRRAVDLMLLVFPFEQAIYDRAGVPATYVGHPLASQIPARPDATAAKLRLQLPVSAPIVAVLPGSRAAEVEQLGAVFAGAIDLIARADAQVRFVVPVINAALGERFERELAQAGTRANAVTHIVTGRSHDCLEAADAVLVASGTATLEAALFQRPMVVSYKVSPLSFWLHKRRGYVRWIGLPNLLANEALVPELLQEAATPAALAAAVLKQLEGGPAVDRLRERFAAMHAQLHRDTANLAADAIVQTIDRRRTARVATR